MQSRAKVGLLNVCMEVYPHHMSDPLVREFMDKLGPICDVVDYGKIFEMAQAVEAAGRIRHDAPDLLVMLFGTWLDMSVAMTALNLLEGIPTLIWALPMIGGESTGSLVAFAVAKGALERTGQMGPYIYGLADEAVAAVKDKARGVALSKSLKTTRLGLFGYASMGIYTATFDHLMLKQRLGPEVVHIDTYAVAKRMETLAKDEVDRAFAEITARHPLESPGLTENATRAIKMYLAMKGIAREEHLDGVTHKCMFEVSRSIGCACLPLSLLIEEGTPCSDEGDVYALTTMLLMDKLGGGPCYFSDFINADGPNVWFSTCGFIAPSLTQEGVVLRQQVEEVGTEGVILSGKPKLGQVTIARLEEAPGKQGFRMHIARGKVVEGFLRKHTKRDGKVYHLFPICRVELPYSSRRFIDNVCSNHYILAWQDIYGDLLAMCGELGIRTMTDEEG